MNKSSQSYLYNLPSSEKTEEKSARINAEQALNYTVKSWFVFALAGQLFFALYIAFRYGVPVSVGNPEGVNIGPKITGFVSGDFSGNNMLFIHVFGASILSLCGMMQLVPKLRQAFPRIHKVNGRLFLIMGLSGALSGLYLTWLRESRLSDFGALGTTINGLLIPIAIYFTWKFAIKRDIRMHERWAVHSFFLINATWTLRLMLMGWAITTKGYGMNETLDGPADMFFGFGCYLVPMLFAEVYFWAKRQKSEKRKWSCVFILGFGSVITLVGVIAASLVMWLPRISTVVSSL